MLDFVFSCIRIGFLTYKPGSDNYKNLTSAGFFVYSCQLFFLHDFWYKQNVSGNTREKLAENRQKLSNKNAKQTI